MSTVTATAEGRGRAGDALPDAAAQRRFLRIWIGLLLLGVALGLGAWIYQLANGLAATNMRNPMMWGLYITLFMYFVGLSAGGLIVASAGRLFGATRLKPVVRVAVLEAMVAVMIAALLLLPDIGRPDRVWHLLAYAHFTSPLVWDLTIVTVYFLISATYVWVYTRADLARAGSPLALGTGTGEGWLRRDDLLKGVLAAVGLPAAILLHSITAWIFGLQISRGFWYSAIMAPMFIASALVSGTALMILLALVVRRAGRVSFKDDLVRYLGGMLAVFVAVEAFLVFSEMLTAAYPGAGFEADPAWRLLNGPYAGFFWFEVLAGLVVPFVLLAVPRLRARPGWVAAASLFAVAGILIHRVNIVLNGLSYATVPYPPGVPIGVAQPVGQTSFALTYFYKPALIEYLVAGGVICFGALVFTLLAWKLPLREHTHEAEPQAATAEAASAGEMSAGPAAG
jgi:molybdopterin-containing oxidoreductase family membrane subunit